MLLHSIQEAQSQLQHNTTERKHGFPQQIEDMCRYKTE